eukprot:sb/3466099/
MSLCFHPDLTFHPHPDTTDCKEGTYLDLEGGTCLPCPLGTYQNLRGQESCKPCPESIEVDVTLGHVVCRCMADVVCDEAGNFLEPSLITASSPTASVFNQTNPHDAPSNISTALPVINSTDHVEEEDEVNSTDIIPEEVNSTQAAPDHATTRPVIIGETKTNAPVNTTEHSNKTADSDSKTTHAPLFTNQDKHPDKVRPKPVTETDKALQDLSKTEVTAENSGAVMDSLQSATSDMGEVTAAGVEAVAGVLEQLSEIPGSGEAVVGIASNLMTADESAISHKSKNRYNADTTECALGVNLPNSLSPSLLLSVSDPVLSHSLPSLSISSYFYTISACTQCYQRLQRFCPILKRTLP